MTDISSHDPNGQALADALAQQLRPDNAGQPVQQLQTHISHVLLTAEHAWKLKKPITLPFADFSSVAARRHFCEEELRLNQRLAPGLYLDVRPVLGSVQAPRIGEPVALGAPAPDGTLDWVVRMRRFAPGTELSTLLSLDSPTHSQASNQAPALPPALLDDFAQHLAQFYAACPAAADDAPWGSAEQVGQAIGDVCNTLESLLTAEEATRLHALRQWYAAQQPALSQHWAARRAQGWVREGHGDLHLGNVVKLESGITAFDCIEFSPALRWLDPQADVGFFTMDLLAHGQPALASRFLNAYLAATGDYAGLAVLRPYEVYRALVRAMAGRFAAGPGNTPTGPDYLALAEQLAAPRAPRLLITYGLSGSGKSTITQGLLQASGAIRLRSDVERKRLHGLAPLQASQTQGLNIYTAEASRRTFEHLAEQAQGLLQAGWSVIVDAAFLCQGERQRFHDLAQRLGLPFAILHCQADGATLRARIAQRQAQGQDPSEATATVLAQQEQQAQPLTPQELAHTLTLDTTGLTAAHFTAADANALHQRWLALA